MIWALVTIMALACFAALFAPLKSSASETPAEARAYLDEIEKVEVALAADPDNAGLQARLVQMQKQALATANGQSTARISRPFSLSLIGLLSLVTIGFYAGVGKPDLTRTDALQRIEPEPETMTLDQLAEQLARRLEADPNQPNGWVLYGRSLMTLQRYDEARVAYDRALELAPDNENIIAERDSAVRFMENPPPGPTAAQIEAASQMSAEEQQAMITQMVAGLSDRLRDNPDDPQGWVRLLRARKVLEQSEAAAEDIALIRESFADRPELIDQIITAGGWSE